MVDFFRFPHTPHLVWLGKATARDDKVLPLANVTVLLSDEIVVEEKLDGANLGLSLSADGILLVQNRGQYLAAPYAGQFTRLSSWLAQHKEALYSILTADLILFGEWCAARHALDYVALPDWFLLFDVYDCTVGRFWSTARRNRLAASAGLTTVPELAKCKTSVDDLIQLVMTTNSRYRNGQLEGVIIRHDFENWCATRAKLVHPTFSQVMDRHWSQRVIEWNRIDAAQSSAGAPAAQ